MPTGILPSDDWHRTIIIAGGASLTGVPLEVFRGRRVLVVNDGMMRLPWASGVVSVDMRWMEHRKSELNEFRGEKFLIPQCQIGFEIQGATVLQYGYSTGLSLDSAIVNGGGHGGYAALNVAVLLGARHIYMLGYDYYDRDQHWHPAYPWRTGASDSVYARWAASFADTTQQLIDLGIQVLNVGRDSLVTAFEKCDLAEFMRANAGIAVPG